MDNENSVSYHLGQAAKISAQNAKDIGKSKALVIQCIAAAAYHILFIILAFIFMRNESQTLFTLGWIITPVYIIGSFILNIKKHIPWEAFWIYTAGAAVQFILNVTHIVPTDISIVLSGFAQSLWCTFIVFQEIVLFLFTLIPFLVYRKKAKKNEA